jgi:hypothetical protein
MMSFEMCKVSASVNMKILSFARLIGSARSERKWNERRQSLSCMGRTIRAKSEHTAILHTALDVLRHESENLFGITVFFYSCPRNASISHGGLHSHYCTHTQLRFNPAREMIALKPCSLLRRARSSLKDI